MSTAAMTFTLFTFNLHLGKVKDNKLLIKADDDTYFSIDVTADMRQGETIQVVIGYPAPTVCSFIHYIGVVVNPLMKWLFGSIPQDAVLEIIADNFVTTKAINIVVAQYIKDSDTLVFSGVAENIEIGV